MTTTISLLIVNGLLLVAWMLGVLHRQRLLGTAQVELKGLNEKITQSEAELNQTQMFLEDSRLRMALADDQRARHAKLVAGMQAELARLSSQNFEIIHQLGEPAKGKTPYAAELFETGMGDRPMPKVLQGLTHMAIVHAEDDAAARRQIEIAFPPRSLFRPNTITRMVSADDTGA
ncbi:hypothetical protein [Rhodospirillum centenum]|uniref:Uncharacterized protein n=1 Tax=Rhodospirillum centenum (strain ATCC 51521 / SW) TaxID=414684 RepID=B6IXZ9_RHOCS|nr:hypothetical protein [Rhodospirillum centenum]ACJ01173.1 hypothetical protein RC1_3830 [Rhodospirillum centenum SW]